MFFNFGLTCVHGTNIVVIRGCRNNTMVLLRRPRVISILLGKNIMLHTHMQMHNDDTIKMSGHSSLEKYTSHFIRKGYKRYYLWEVSWRLNRIVTYWPPNSSGYNSISFQFSWAAQPGAWEPGLCWDMVLMPASSLQLIWTSCCTGLYNNLTSTYFWRASQFTLN